MNDQSVRLKILDVIGIVGELRSEAKSAAPADNAYIERELDVVQAATHRLLAFIEDAELPTQ